MTENNKPISYPIGRDIDKDMFSDILSKAIDADVLDVLFDSKYESEKFKILQMIMKSSLY